MNRFGLWRCEAADVFKHFSCTFSAGIDLENIVYYRDNTHYFVMTAKKQSLLDKGVIINVNRIAKLVYWIISNIHRTSNRFCGSLS